MKKETKIFILITVITVAILTALDIQTKGKITSLVGSVNPMNLKSSDVPYTNNSQSTVQGAIDDLYTKVTPDNMLTSKVLANKRGLCIYRKGRLHCFKINNWSVEKKHIQQVFSDDSCIVNSSSVGCYASEFYCNVSSNGSVDCRDYYDDSYCSVNSAGSVGCD